MYNFGYFKGTPTTKTAFYKKHYVSGILSLAHGSPVSSEGAGERGGAESCINGLALMASVDISRGKSDSDFLFNGPITGFVYERRQIAQVSQHGQTMMKYSNYLLIYYLLPIIY